MKTHGDLPRMCIPTMDYTKYYPQATELAKQQRKILWTPDEILVSKDIQDMKTNLTESEKHGVITVLRLFTTYELKAGGEYWGDRVMRDFPRPDIQQMATAFSYMESNVHAVFYDEINRLLGLSTPEFYLGYVDNPVLKERMEFIDEYIDHEDKLTSLGVFSIVEGAVLYSSFAFLCHFQNQPKNKLVNINAGIAFSVKDEMLHSVGGAWLYKTLKKEMNLDKRSIIPLEARIVKAAYKIWEHEKQIIEMIFEKGKILGITKKQMKNFVKSRINLCLEQLDIEPIFEIENNYNPIAKWFYKMIGGGQVHDFFFNIGSDYNRDWPEEKLGFVARG